MLQYTSLDIVNCAYSLPKVIDQKPNKIKRTTCYFSSREVSIGWMDAQTLEEILSLKLQFQKTAFRCPSPPNKKKKRKRKGKEKYALSKVANVDVLCLAQWYYKRHPKSYKDAKVAK